MRFAKRNKLYVCHDERGDYYERIKEKDNPYVIRDSNKRIVRPRVHEYDLYSSSHWGSRLKWVFGRDIKIVPVGESPCVNEELFRGGLGCKVSDSLRGVRALLNSGCLEYKPQRKAMRQYSQKVGYR